MKIKGIEIGAAIFDLDGTIADSTGVWDLIDIDFFTKRGMELPKDYKDAIKSMDYAQSARYTKKTYQLPESEEEIIEEWNRLAQEEYANSILLKPGALDFLTALKKGGVKLGLATASGQALYEPLLRRNGAYHLFDACVTTTQTGKDKTSPDVYLFCAEQLGCDPQSCIVFEDIAVGVRSAKSVGMLVAGVYDPGSAHEREEITGTADFYIENFGDALELLKQE